ncbi:MAG: tRNA (adenosine(37)-N6)-threonylcarbamoyltransferase complex dimerization subunit type 1 TsaB [Actinomycetia bacterium]|nr:tRNA (adenosine(37)-N6)-threonylcarbamoyltransferase complex dimerization subunit type 1 TsaB [Actinomycetes bacterium]
MHILSIDSTTKKLSVIISRDGEVISKVSRESDQNYMEMIMGDIDSALERARMSIREIDALGVNLGPGDFTGTRIGISIIKTLGRVLNKPAYGINALDIFASGIASSNPDLINSNIDSNIQVIIAPCLDVRKGELYYCLYSIAGDEKEDNKDKEADTIANIVIDRKSYKISRISGRHLVSADAFFDDLLINLKKAAVGADTGIIFGGNAVESYGENFSAFTAGSERYSLDKNNVFPVPEFLDLCVSHCSSSKDMPKRINPVYVREFIPFGK